jgi:monofunctional glycosyltransferase
VCYLYLLVAKKKNSILFFGKLKRFLFYLFIINLLYVVATRWILPPITTVMISSVLKGNGMSKKYIIDNEIGRNAKLAVICAEDQLFADHNGFDVDAIQKAIRYNNDPNHKKTIGASTISQQTAKNTFLWNGRDWFRKGLEVYYTFMIELIWRKKRILSVYLNIAEMGKGIFGIEAASQHYFHKKAARLTKSEAAWIAAVLPNPVLLKVQNPSAKTIKRHEWILAQMNALSDDPETNKLIGE